MIFVDSTGNRWPQRLKDNNTSNVITFQLFACNGIKNGRLNTEEGSHGAGLGLDSARERWNNDQPSLRLLASVQHQWTSQHMYNLRESIHNRALPLSDVFVVPFPASGLMGSPTLLRSHRLLSSVRRSGSVRFFAPKTGNRGPQPVQDQPRY